MTMLTNLDLVAHARKALAECWGYVWGTFGQLLTPELLAAKCRQYPEGVGNYYDFIKSHWVGRKTADCVGLIKACYWGETGSIKYNASTDVSADGMYERAKEKGLISGMPDIPGICVWKKGHIGIYVGDGYVIEAHGTKYGVIKTKLKGGTPWTHWLKCPYINYTSSPASEPSTTPEAYAISEGKRVVGTRCRELQQKLNTLIRTGALDMPLLDEDGDFGKLTYNTVVAFQKKYALTVDGKAGPQTFGKLEALLAVPAEKYGIVTASVLNVRSGAGTTHGVIGQLKKNTKIRLDTKVGSWWSIYFGNNGGFVHGDYIREV